MAPAIENPYEERQALLLERIIKNVDLLDEALHELNRAVVHINNRNQETTIVAEMWNGYYRNVAFNLENMDSTPHIDFLDPTEDGSILTKNSGDSGGEPLNVIISDRSDPYVLQDTGFTNYADSINFVEGTCLNVTAGGPNDALGGGLQRANLGDGFGSRIQAGIRRYGDGCREALTGGNHLRYWFQNGTSPTHKKPTNAVFLAVSIEESLKKNHQIVPNGYDLGRDQLVGNATKGITRDSSGTEYKTTLVRKDNSLMKGISAEDLNHNINTDGNVAVLLVEVTKKGDDYAASAQAGLAAFMPSTGAMAVAAAIALSPMVYFL
ncbi:hypothetical protein MSPP1_003599 [Malassezia sp. CBS 17886]|nr:hypothetical protein MSPP1_003599 [Malassezia sp. CBS 17886]